MLTDHQLRIIYIAERLALQRSADGRWRSVRIPMLWQAHQEPISFTDAEVSVLMDDGYLVPSSASDGRASLVSTEIGQAALAEAHMLFVPDREEMH